MNFKLQTLVLACICSLIFTAVHAKSDRSGRMHVQISNMTNASCYLSNQILLHGIFDSAPPPSLMANDSKAFDMEQALMGPDAILAYSCGGQNIRFEVQQDASIFMGQTPRIIIHESSGLILQSTSESSSVFWNSPGILYISIMSF